MNAPIRTCIGCRTKAEQSTLARLVWDGHSILVSRKERGRGAWIHLENPDCRAKATRAVLQRALKIPSQVSEGIDQQGVVLPPA